MLARGEHVLVLARRAHGEVVVAIAVEVAGGDRPAEEVVRVRNLGRLLALADDHEVGGRRRGEVHGGGGGQGECANEGTHRGTSAVAPVRTAGGEGEVRGAGGECTPPPSARPAHRSRGGGPGTVPL